MVRVGDSRLGVFALNAILAAVLVFMAAPILIVFINSFNQSPFNVWPPSGFTLNWYSKVLSSPSFQRGMVNTLIVGFSSTTLVLALGTPIAYALARFSFTGKGILRGILFGPMIVPRVAIGFSLFILFFATHSGLYGTLLGLAIAHSVLMLPFVISVLVANLGEVDPSLEEAARDLGAGPLQAFRLAVLPQMRPGLIVAALFAFTTSLDEVETTIFVVKPVVNTLPIEMYLYLEQYQDPTIAALSSLLIGVSFVIALGGMFFLRGGTVLRFMSGGGAR
jgi:putative spermidine/putrescine transport system permease protein